MPDNNLKLKEIKEFLKRIPDTAAKNAFSAFLILLFLSLIFGGFILYKYGFLAQKAEPEVSLEAVQFEEALYQKILAEWQSREERFEAVDSKEYSDPFQP